jgi:tRNA 2-thiouridine synthesizing protein A
METVALDLVGLNCPLPALKTRKALRRLAPGDRLTVRCSDPLAAIDIPHLLRQTGDRLVSMASASGALEFVIEKAARIES